MLKKVKKNILIALTISVLFYLALTIYANFDSVIGAFAKFNWKLIPLLLSLSFLNYISRFVKWDYYLGLLNVKISKKDSFTIFMSGLLMSVTPGKIGELIKSYLVRQVKNEPISKTAPIIFIERVTDSISLLILASIGVFIFGHDKVIIIGTALFFVLLTVTISNRKLSLWILSKLERVTFVHKYFSHIKTAYESSYKMLKPIPLIKMLIVSFVAWFFECFGFYIILINLGINISILWSTFVYAFSTIVGAITMLPAGIGVTDGSLTFLIIDRGYPKDIAVAATFLIRAVTLWFAVLVGIIAVSFYQKKYGKITLEKNNLSGESYGKV